MSLLGNVIWLVFGGFIIAIGYILGGLVLCLTIIGIPFGIQTMKLGLACLTPFGKQVVEKENANSVLRVLFNLLWLCLFGWELVLSHLFLGLIFAVTIVGLPFAKQHIKLIPLALFPFGRELQDIPLK